MAGEAAGRRPSDGGQDYNAETVALPVQRRLPGEEAGVADRGAGAEGVGDWPRDPRFPPNSQQARIKHILRSRFTAVSRHTLRFCRLFI